MQTTFLINLYNNPIGEQTYLTGSKFDSYEEFENYYFKVIVNGKEYDLLPYIKHYDYGWDRYTFRCYGDEGYSVDITNADLKNGYELYFIYPSKNIYAKIDTSVECFVTNSENGI